MAEAFVRTIKRDYVRVSPRPNAETVMRQLPSWFAHYNEVHPHKALGYRSPASSSQITNNPDRVRSFGGYNTADMEALREAFYKAHGGTSKAANTAWHRAIEASDLELQEGKLDRP